MSKKRKNHKSIKNEICFSLLATKDTFNTEQLYSFNDLKVLKSAVIYGANGSGKSNFIDAILFMKSLAANSMGINYSPHKLNSMDSESSYSIQFVKNGIRYAYGFSIKQKLVKDEYLYFFPNRRQAKIWIFLISNMFAVPYKDLVPLQNADFNNAYEKKIEYSNDNLAQLIKDN